MEDTVSLVHQEGQMPAVKLKKGRQHLCVPASGSYSLVFPDSCASYGEVSIPHSGGQGDSPATVSLQSIRSSPSELHSLPAC
ncbi:hypothetical protein CLOM_g21157 [Closterium sp. NIES-68]|nr:hypothetical protein CLOM_g21157 [Closterium sp. NIES-68]GJP36677.1 hypothetical protein CLOM_g21157 [Closterium sp. NIES-68]